MSEVKVYGASDDLIEIEGDLREEIGSYGESKYLAFSEGTVLHVGYNDEGIWRINRRREGSAKYFKLEATDPEGDYTDRVTLRGDIEWCVAGNDLTTKIQPKGDEKR